MRYILELRARICLKRGRSLNNFLFTVGTDIASSCVFLQTASYFDILAKITSWVQLKSIGTLSASTVAVKCQAARLVVS